MRVVAFSDTHIKYPGTRTQQVKRFFRQLANNPPDELVMIGDVWELWRNDIAGAYVQSMDLNGLLWDAIDAAGNTEYIVGNHDYWLLNHTSGEFAEYPVEPRREYETEYDGTPIRFLHGDRFDTPAFNPLVNDALCATDDIIGSASDKIWEFINIPLSPLPTPALFRPLEDFSDPNAIRNNLPRIQTMRDRIALYKDPDQWAIFGHTHLPSYDDERKLVNSGAWTVETPTYVEIIDGDVGLVEYAANA